jgi:DNA primase
VTLDLLVGRLLAAGVPLRQAGKGWRGRCPFCRSDNPTSLSVFDGPSGPRFYCFKCATSGDYIDAVWLEARCASFGEAVAAAAILLGVDHLLSDAP